MNKARYMGIIISVIGILFLMTGGFRMRTASGLRDGASDFLRRQQDAQATFHQEAAQVTKRYQAGELDEAVWRRETEAVSSRFKTVSESAGVAWGDQLASANQTQQQGFGLLLTGLLGVVVGLITAARTGRNAQQDESTLSAEAAEA